MLYELIILFIFNIKNDLEILSIQNNIYIKSVLEKLHIYKEVQNIK